jgi:hypothetical protein
LAQEDPFRERISIVRRPAKDITLDAPEVRCLSQVLSSSLTADRYANPDHFLERYIGSQSGFEDQVRATSNHIVFGRRGAGKSTLLVFAQHDFRRRGKACVWLDMQPYDQRTDSGVLVDVLKELATELERVAPGSMRPVLAEIGRIDRGGDSSLASIRKTIPTLKTATGAIARDHSGLCIFLDDLHVLPPERQPELLSLLYSFSRGTQIWLKISALEHFTSHWDPARRLGLDVPGDAQLIRLDYSLTNPERALQHTTSIMDAIAGQCALPGISSMLNRDVLPRLVWVAAGVPRDALNILQQAIANAAQRRHARKAGQTRRDASTSRKRVAVEDVNVAASRCLEDKLRFLSLDSSSGREALETLLEQVRQFCIKDQKRNAFLVPIQHNDERYQQFLKLIDLRFLHVLNQGITRNRPGEKYVALLLDYGFYTGTRRAKTIDVLQKEPGRLRYETLRKLPVFPL